MGAVFAVQTLAGWVGPSWTGLPRDRKRWLRNIFLIAVFALVEELIFRLLMITALRRGVGIDAAVFISSAAFGLVHATNTSGRQRWIVAFESFIAGAWFGYAFVVSGSIALVSGLHAGWNLSMWQVFGYPESGPRWGFEGFFKTRATRPGLLSGGDYGPEASLPAMIADLAWVVGLRTVL